jgi:octanoyl-[GcvH]:protein N-octanoyltransferase
VHVLRGAAASVEADRAATAELAARTRETGEPGLRVWYPPAHVAFGRRDRTADGYDRARRAAADRGYPSIERETGGRAVAFTGGVLALARTEPADPATPAVGARYERVLSALETGLEALEVPVERGEPPASFCPGTRSLQSDGKVAGLAQRITDGIARVGGVIVVRDPDSVARVLAPVYDALGVPFGPDTVGDLAAAGRSNQTVRDQIETALIGDAPTTIRRVRDT